MRPLLTKDQLKEQLKILRSQGLLKSRQPINHGGIGVTLDHLLGVPSGNLPLSDTAQWELKTHRRGSPSHVTLFHLEPKPKIGKGGVVTGLLLPKYGWPHQTMPGEMSFRQTLRATVPTDRGFGIRVDRNNEKVVVYFESSCVSAEHQAWLSSVAQRAGLGSLSPEPYWSFQDLFFKASTKLLNTFYVEVDAEKLGSEEYFRICQIIVLENFDPDRLIAALESGQAVVDFDARTGHNHGTKFRIRGDCLPDLYRFREAV